MEAQGSNSDDDARRRARLKKTLDAEVGDVTGREPTEDSLRHASLTADIIRQAADSYAAGRATLAARLRAVSKLTFARLGEIMNVTRARAQEITRKGEEPLGPTSIPEPQPVVAAIVTSRFGVLVGKRHDGKPPWTFIAGEIEPGESPEDAGVREVKEETGLLVRARGEIGRRVHPTTKRTMIYMAATPTHGTKVHVGDEDELAEVRWATLAEADQLLPGMFEPVRDYLGRKIAD